MNQWLCALYWCQHQNEICGNFMLEGIKSEFNTTQTCHPLEIISQEMKSLLLWILLTVSQA